MATIILTALVLFFTFPFFVRVNFAYSSIKKSIFIKIYFYGIKILTVRGVIADKLLYSVGKSIKAFDLKKSLNRKRKPLPKPHKETFSVYVKLIVIYGKQDMPVQTSLICTFVKIFADYIKSLDMDINHDIDILPIYNNDITCVRSELKIVTNPLKIFLMLM